MRVVSERYHDGPGYTRYCRRWNVEHEGKVLNSFRTRDEARKAIRDSGRLAEKLVEDEDQRKADEKYHAQMMSD